MQGFSNPVVQLFANYEGHVLLPEKLALHYM
jgi:hypothetical protein